MPIYAPQPGVCLQPVTMPPLPVSPRGVRDGREGDAGAKTDRFPLTGGVLVGEVGTQEECIAARVGALQGDDLLGRRGRPGLMAFICGASH
jgi:hypothetical protein